VSGSGEPSRSYHLKRRESVPDGLRRVATGRAEQALDALRDGGEDPAKAIHAARKDMKKLRAVLRLSRDELGGKVFRAESDRFRDAGRLLSSSRDAEVKLETVLALGRRFGSELPAHADGPWVLALKRERDEVAGREALSTPAVDQAMELIELGRDAIAGWPLRTDSWDAIGPGLSRTYRRGRRGLEDSIAHPGVESTHEWRKRVKDLTYQLRLVARAWPQLLDQMAAESHRLTDLLGEHHDLALLAADLEDRDLGSRARLAELIVQRQEELRGEALPLGRHVYAEKPKAFERRMRSYWEAWRGEA
jgi:CHAD domain-containing protein